MRPRPPPAAWRPAPASPKTPTCASSPSSTRTSPASLRSPVSLNRLVDRLAAGEFELIVAHTGEGRLVTLQAGFDTDAQPDPVRCAVYVRCASPSQATPNPLADQWDACEGYAARQGWRTIAVHKDHAVSGRKTSRLSLNSLMAQARQGAFEVLLVESLDRLSREALHLHALLTELTGLGVAVHTVAGPVDLGFILPEARS